MKVILDSGVLMNLDHLPEITGEFYTTPSALNELKSSQTRLIFDMFAANHKISIINPEQYFIDRVIHASKSIGQLKLSDTDQEILGLALNLGQEDEILLLSDDYGLRNVAHKLGITSKGVKTSGGNMLRKFNYICLGCNAVYNYQKQECDTCGTTSFHRKRRNK